MAGGRVGRRGRGRGGDGDSEVLGDRRRHAVVRGDGGGVCLDGGVGRHRPRHLPGRRRVGKSRRESRDSDGDGVAVVGDGDVEGGDGFAPCVGLVAGVGDDRLAVGYGLGGAGARRRVDGDGEGLADLRCAVARGDGGGVVLDGGVGGHRPRHLPRRRRVGESGREPGDPDGNGVIVGIGDGDVEGRDGLALVVGLVAGVGDARRPGHPDLELRLRRGWCGVRRSR